MVADTLEVLSDAIGSLEHSIGFRRVWWHDRTHDWQVRVSVTIGSSDRCQIRIESGPCWDHGGTPDGTWGDESRERTIVHVMEGDNVGGLIDFAEYVQERVVGDSLILTAVNYLVAVQQAVNEQDAEDEAKEAQREDAREIRRANGWHGK